MINGNLIDSTITNQMTQRLMINGNLIDSTITNQRTQRLEVPPPQAADMEGLGPADPHGAATEPIGGANVFP